MIGILDELKSKKLTFESRIFMPAMATAKADDDGFVTQDLLDYYNEKTSGGYFSVVVTEHSYVDKSGMAHPNQVSVSKDEDIEGLKKLADTIKGNSCLAVCQISHSGSAGKESVIGTEPMSASAIENPMGDEGVIPKEMTVEDIKRIEDRFAEAALRVKKAGFDGVEIHSAHGYLLNQFYSPLRNVRKDEYGGDTEGRIRIHKEIIRKVREAVGEDYPIFLRLGACDYVDGGNTVDDAIIASRAFENEGVDVLDISGGCIYRYKLPDQSIQGYFGDVSSKIKAAVSIPVIVAGGVKNEDGVRKMLDNDEADIIGIGRALLKDSLWAKKLVEGLKK